MQHKLWITKKYKQSLSYDGLDLCCFKVTNAPHKNIKDNIKAVKLNHCDQELQYFHTAILGSLAFVNCIVNDVHNCKLLRLRMNNHHVSVAWYNIYDVSTYSVVTNFLILQASRVSCNPRKT